MDLKITKKINDKWVTLSNIRTNQWGKISANISLSNAKKIVEIIEAEGKEYKGDKYIYLPVFENQAKPDLKPIDSHSEAKGNGFMPDDTEDIPF